MMTTDAAPRASRADLQAEVARTRAELAATVDALTTQLSPRYQANRAKDATVTAAGDTVAALTGGGFPSDARRARNSKVLLATVAVAGGIIAYQIIRFVVRGRRRA